MARKSRNNKINITELKSLASGRNNEWSKEIMEPKIKAIETEYKGYRFRSRLEARWAVFFDNFGLDWEYEKEGFELPSGRYLPDFWVQWGQCFSAWIEVKGVRPDVFSVECELCHQLANASCKQVLMVVGIPGENYIDQYLPDNSGYVNGAAKLSDFLGTQDRIDYAIQYAKSARFEHGEKP
jgi:hypothetical protein